MLGFAVAAVIIAVFPPLWPLAVCAVLAGLAWRAIQYYIQLLQLYLQLYGQNNHVNIREPKHLTPQHINSVWNALPQQTGTLTVHHQHLNTLTDVTLIQWSFPTNTANQHNLRELHLVNCTLAESFFAYFPVFKNLVYVSLRECNNVDTELFKKILKVLTNCKKLQSLHMTLNLENSDQALEEAIGFVLSREDPASLDLVLNCKIPVAQIMDPYQKILFIGNDVKSRNIIGKFEASIISAILERHQARRKVEVLRLGSVSFELKSLKHMLESQAFSYLFSIDLGYVDASLLSIFKETIRKVCSNGAHLQHLVRVSPHLGDSITDNLIKKNRTIKAATLQQAGNQNKRSRTNLRVDELGLTLIQKSGIFGSVKESFIQWSEVSLIFQNDVKLGFFQIETSSIQILFHRDLLDFVRLLTFLTPQPRLEIARVLYNFHWTFCESKFVLQTLWNVEDSLLQAGLLDDSGDEKSVSDYLSHKHTQVIQDSFADLLNFERDLRKIVNGLGFEQFSITKDSPRLQKLLNVKKSLEEPSVPNYPEALPEEEESEEVQAIGASINT